MAQNWEEVVTRSVGLEGRRPMRRGDSGVNTKTIALARTKGTGPRSDMQALYYSDNNINVYILTISMYPLFFVVNENYFGFILKYQVI